MWRCIKLPVINRYVGRAQLSEIASGPEKEFVKWDKRKTVFNVMEPPKYGGEHIVTLIVGSTLLGRRGAAKISRLFESAMVPVAFERVEIGPDLSGLESLVLSVHRNRAALQVCAPHDPVKKTESYRLNNSLDLYASVIKLRSYPGFNCRHPDAKLTIITQNNSADMSKLEYEPVKGIVETLRITEDKHIRRYLHFVFNYANKYKHKKITIGHKYGALPITDGRFMDLAKQLEREKKFGIEVEMMDIDNLVLALVIDPTNFDLVCTSDRYGTFVAAIASAICGGAGLFSAVELSEFHAVFKPLEAKLSITDVHILSPYGIVRSCIDLLEYLGHVECAQALEDQLIKTMMKDKIKTSEYGGTDSHEFVISHIVNGLRCYV